MREYENPNNNYSSSTQKSGFGAVVLIIVGLFFLLGPLFLPEGVIPGASVFIISVLGVVTLIVGAILYLLTKLYIKTPSNRAFVRTGMGGKKVIIDGGTIFIPMFHEKMEISTETMKIEVSRMGNDALLTKDMLRADVKAEFYINVAKNADSVNAAATTLGSKGINPESIKALVEDKVVSALRSVAAQSPLEELNSNRQGFAEKVQEIVAKDLQPNGLTLETTTCSKLDQANYETINTNNVFDAQGAQTIAEKTQKAIIAKNEIVRNAEVSIATKNLETTQKTNDLKITEEKSIAEKDKSVRVLQAMNDSEARTKQAELDRVARESEITAEQQVAVKEQEKLKAVETAQVDKEKVVKLANIEKEQSISVKAQEKLKAEEIAAVDKEKAVIEKKAEQALSEKKKSEAEKGAAEAAQEVITVNEVKKAERQKQVTVVNEEAVAKTNEIKQNVETDIAAYKTTKLAEANKEAAKNSAEAVTVEAEAKLKAKKFEAEGQEAVQMVPINVNKAQVAVNAEQVEVTGKELKYKAEFSQVSITLETNLANINAQKEVGIAAAQAMGLAFSKANMNIWGDGNTAATMFRQFTEGQGTFIKLQALNDGGVKTNVPSEEAKNMVAAYMKGQITAMEINGATDNVSTEVKALVKDFVQSGGANTMAGIGLMFKAMTGNEPTKKDTSKLEELVKTIVPDQKKPE